MLSIGPHEMEKSTALLASCIKRWPLGTSLEPYLAQLSFFTLIIFVFNNNIVNYSRIDKKKGEKLRQASLV
jgi:hypothetical protein